MDGLFWKTEWKKEPVAYGIFKIQIGATVEDDKVSTDLVQEKIEEFEDEVQSVDIVAFNKLWRQFLLNMRENIVTVDVYFYVRRKKAYLIIFNIIFTNQYLISINFYFLN